MEKGPIKMTRYGAKVWGNEEMDLLRSRECLCLNCGHLNEGCKQSRILLAICKTFNLAFMMTRCPDWIKR